MLSLIFIAEKSCDNVTYGRILAFSRPFLAPLFSPVWQLCGCRARVGILGPIAWFPSETRDLC